MIRKSCIPRTSHGSVTDKCKTALR